MTLPLCGCFCSRQVNTRKREFLPGHDAKLKSVMQHAYRTDTKVQGYDGEELSAEHIANQRGWQKFLTDGKPKGDSVDPNAAADHVDAPISVTGFRPVRVKVGRWIYDAQVVNYPNDHDVTVEYKDKSGDLHTVTVGRDKIVDE